MNYPMYKYTGNEKQKILDIFNKAKKNNYIKKVNYINDFDTVIFECDFTIPFLRLSNGKLSNKISITMSKELYKQNDEIVKLLNSYRKLSCKKILAYGAILTMLSITVIKVSPYIGNKIVEISNNEVEKEAQIYKSKCNELLNSYPSHNRIVYDPDDNLNGMEHFENYYEEYYDKNINDDLLESDNIEQSKSYR